MTKQAVNPHLSDICMGVSELSRYSVPERMKRDFTGNPIRVFSKEKARPSAAPLTPCFEVSKPGHSWSQHTSFNQF